MVIALNNMYRVLNLKKIFEISENEKIIFENMNLEIDNNKITVVLGKSGCGKTTLLRMIAGLEEITYGSIDFYNKSGEKVKAKIGMVFQESRLMPWLTVKENIEIHGNKIDTDKYLKMISLEEFKDAYPLQLSGGMAQRVAIARALSYQPDTLLMDEPFSALDYFTREQLQREIIKVYEKTETGIIFVTHNIDEALMLGHRIIVINEGKIYSYDIAKKFPRDIADMELINLKKEILKKINN
ncbi:ATP-binding cassette domain-containing protein [uncultured Fusobacterium sp.]|uniref:ABC transporter ATP-binding protein n=1 Tax=uncultured Fusobacterium sp. TaxID=159267 RepID=UPI0025EE4E65|nr:ATP-binding cassette domain-containing protein [uncultured Fusobacterium sp.]